MKSKQYDLNMNRSKWVPNNYVCDDDTSNTVTILKNTGTMSAHSAVLLTTETLNKMMKGTPVKRC